MRAISDRYGAPEAAVAAISAGCDCVLLCGPDVDEHAVVLEALIRAVEQDRLPVKRVEDAMARQRRAKERFLSGAPAGPTPRDWRTVVGCDAHQAIAREMTGYL